MKWFKRSERVGSLLEAKRAAWTPSPGDGITPPVQRFGGTATGAGRASGHRLEVKSQAVPPFHYPAILHGYQVDERGNEKRN